MKKEKLKLAIVSLASCEGCQFAILELGQRFFDLFEHYELVEMRLFEDEPDVPLYDICLIEGSAVIEEELETLKKVRKKSKILVALGACAVLGGIPERGNQEIRPLREMVKIDFEIPGCPPVNTEILEALEQLRFGRIPKIPEQTICFECPFFGQDCYLHQKKACLGPIILAGCGAVCLKNNYRCEGCRGPLKDEKKENIRNMLKLLKQISQPREIEHLLQKFGLEDDLFED